MTIRLLVLLVVLGLMRGCGDKVVRPVPTPTPTPVGTATPTPFPTPLPLPAPPQFAVLEPLPVPNGEWVEIRGVEDVGVAVNAVQAAGAKRILIVDSGAVRTPIVVGEGVRVVLDVGVVLTTHTVTPPFLLKDGASIVGPGKDLAAIVESDVPTQWTVIGDWAGSVQNGAPSRALLVRGLEIRGVQGHPFNSTPQAVALGNCRGCAVQDVWVNGTHSIGVQVGGGDSWYTPNGVEHRSAEDVVVTHCRFTRVASQSLAMVNGRRISFTDNSFDAPGQVGGPGSHPIDMELNGERDVAYQIYIRRNYIDMRGASVNGNGIIAQVTTGSMEIGEIYIENNVLIGGSPYPPVTNWMSNGVYVFGPTLRGVTVRYNRIWRTGLAGLNIEGTDLTITDNELVDVGGGGTAGVILNHVKGASEFSRNSFRYVGSGPVSSQVLRVESPNVRFEGNVGFDL